MSRAAIMVALVALFGCAIAVQAGTPGTLTDCGAGAAKASFSTLTIMPNPPVKGKLAMLNATGTVTEAATGGKYTIAVSLGGAELYSHSGNVCGDDTINLPLGFGKINYGGPACPTTSGGAFKVGLSILLPEAAPAGNYDVKITGTDQSSAALYCLDAKFSF